jgi:RHH-type rel operon transcriptional repressor/antitoxin RelB
MRQVAMSHKYLGVAHSHPICYILVLYVIQRSIAMLAVRLPEQLESRLTSLAKSTHRSKSYYVQRALEEFLADQEDHLLALARLEKNNPRLTLEEMQKRLNDLED